MIPLFIKLTFSEKRAGTFKEFEVNANHISRMTEYFTDGVFSSTKINLGNEHSSIEVNETIKTIKQKIQTAINNPGTSWYTVTYTSDEEPQLLNEGD